MRRIYKTLLSLGKPILRLILLIRAKRGKEDPARLHERMGQPQKLRPNGSLIWLHAASVGEAQSALILMEHIIEAFENIQFLVTTGTVTSAQMMKKNLPENAFHQYYPLDNPGWVENFLDHWRPNLILWMESELWPNMLWGIQDRKIPCAMINGRLSGKSFERWSKFKKEAQSILQTFNVLLTQTEKDAENYKQLGAWDAKVTGNLKFSAQPLPVDDIDLSDVAYVTEDRPMWLFASTHEGEEDMACRIHKQLKTELPNVLTIIVPRHPDRRGRVAKTCEEHQLKYTLRGAHHHLPSLEDDIYIGDTMGELGLFYRLVPIACIGRSFSKDGGGGHNPIEAAQLECAVLYGPNVQYQQEIYDEMYQWLAAMPLKTEEELKAAVERLLKDETERMRWQTAGTNYATTKTSVIDRVMSALGRTLLQAGLQPNAEQDMDEWF